MKIFVILSIFCVCIGIMIQTKMLKKRHPNAELLMDLLQILGNDRRNSESGTIGTIGNGKN
jgi:hypothetical protein